MKREVLGCKSAQPVLGGCAEDTCLQNRMLHTPAHRGVRVCKLSGWLLNIVCSWGVQNEIIQDGWSHLMILHCQREEIWFLFLLMSLSQVTTVTRRSDAVVGDRGWVCVGIAGPLTPGRSRLTCPRFLMGLGKSGLEIKSLTSCFCFPVVQKTRLWLFWKL